MFRYLSSPAQSSCQGTNFNTVPAECRFTVDRRTDPGEDFEAEKRRLFEIGGQARSRDLEIEVRTIQEGRSSSPPPDAPLGRALAESVTAITGHAPAFEPVPACSKSGSAPSVASPAFACGPGILAVSHGPQEFVKISRMVERAKFYALTAARMLART